MTVSISNMAQVWMSNTNTYNSIAMSVSTMGYGANSKSTLLKLGVDGNTKFQISANGYVSALDISANTITVNTIIALSSANSLSSNTITSNTIVTNTILSNNIVENVNGFYIDRRNGYTTITNKTRVVFQVTGGGQTWTIPGGVSYVFVKMWGGGGGGGSYGGWRQGSTGGAGGYSEGIVPVVAGQTMSIRVGQCGYARWGTGKAYPDGGGASTSGGDNQYCAAGGGSSSIAVPNINSGTWCMFAGGGGGGGSVNGWARTPGGAGGGINGEDAYNDLTTYTPYAYVGKGGTQSAGGAAPTPSSSTGQAGSYNAGGTHQGSAYGGGGGGGYYGGSSGVYYSSSMSGGGGGSGFIHSSIIRGITLTGVREYPPMYSDPDAVQYSIGTGFRIGTGGDEASTGGYGLVVIYY